MYVLYLSIYIENLPYYYDDDDDDFNHNRNNNTEKNVERINHWVFFSLWKQYW